MAAPSLAALQTAIYGALVNAAAIQALVGNPARVYDHVPQSTAFPYVVIGDDETARLDTTTRNGFEVAIEISVYDRSDEATNRRGRLKTRQILDAIYGVLHDQALAVAGNACLPLLYDGGGTVVEDDGLTVRGVAQYRTTLQGT